MKIFKYYTKLVFGLILLLPSPFYTEDYPSISEFVDQISSDSLIMHLRVLGNDSLEGRATGTPGGEKATRYIAGKLKKYQVLPGAEDKSYYQNIPMHGSIPLPDSRLRLYATGHISDFEMNQDYLLYKTGAQTFVPTPVPLVFVGYGIIAPEFDYNDYQSIGVDGKIVVFLEGEPFSEDSTYFNGKNPTIYSLPESKQRIAISRGALGSCLISLPRQNEEEYWEKLKNEFAFEDISLAYNITGHLSVIFKPESAARLFDESGYSLSDVVQMAANNNLKSFPLNKQLSFKGEFIERNFTAANLVGLVHGKEQKDSYILISAHYDHLGLGPVVEGDSIYNGVVDNATGVAAALEIARVMAKLPEPPERSIIFLLTTGEEKGLLGATYYTDHPIYPLYKTVANINIDGLAIFDTFNEVVGIGSELSNLDQFLVEASDLLNLSISGLPNEFLTTESFARSDQIAFAQAGIPSMLIMEGLHQKHQSEKQALEKFIHWMEATYHTPFDDLNQPIDNEAMLEHTRVILATILLLANSDQTPEWKPGVAYKNIRLQTIAEKR